MKKNITFLLLPLVASGSIFAMDNDAPSISGSSFDSTELFYGPQNQEATTQESTHDLFASVMLPTEAKDPGFFTKLANRAYGSKATIIHSLQTQQFDTKDGYYFGLLHDALEQATKKEDLVSLAKLIALTQSTDEYKNNIRITDPIAQPTFDFLSKKYTERVDHANTDIENIHQSKVNQYNERNKVLLLTLKQIIGSYNQDIKTLVEQYNTEIAQETEHVAEVQKSVQDFSKLNAGIRGKTAELLQSKTVKSPTINPIAQAHTKESFILNAIHRTGEIPLLEQGK